MVNPKTQKSKKKKITQKNKGFTLPDFKTY